MAKAILYDKNEEEWCKKDIDITTPDDIRRVLNDEDVEQIKIDDWQKHIFFSLSALAQQKSISGRVQNADGDREMFCYPFILAEGNNQGQLVDISQETIEYFNRYGELF